MAGPQLGKSRNPFPSGHVLGTARSRFSVYVVSPHSAPLEVDMPEHDFLTAPADFTVTATPPIGMRLAGGHMTVLMPGVVLEDGSLEQFHPIVSHGRRGEVGRVWGGPGSRERGRPARLFRRIGNHRKCSNRGE